MAQFVKPNPAGYSTHDPITAAQMNLINDQLPKAPNFTDGSATYAPLGVITVAGAGMKFNGGTTLGVTGAGTKVQVESGAVVNVDGASSAINLVNAAQFVAASGTYVTVNGLLQLDGSVNLTPSTTFTMRGTLDCVSGSQLTIRGGMGVVNGGVLTASAGSKIDLVGTGVGSGPAQMTLKDTCSIDLEDSAKITMGAATRLEGTAGAAFAGSFQMGATGAGNALTLDFGSAVVVGSASRGCTANFHGDTNLYGPMVKSGARAVVAERVTNIPDSASSSTPVTLSVADADVFLIDNVNSTQARTYKLDKTTVVPPKGAKMRFSRHSGSGTPKSVVLQTDSGSPTTIATIGLAIGWAEAIYSGTEWVLSAWGGTVT